MPIKVNNTAWGLLSATITDTDTLIYFADVSLFPTLGVDDYFYGTLINTSNQLEIVKVTEVDVLGNTMTVERGAEGTTSRGYTATDRMEQRVTAQTVVDLFTQNSIDALAAQLAAEAAAASVIDNLFFMGEATGTAGDIELTAPTPYDVASSDQFYIVENTAGENPAAATFKLNALPDLPLRTSAGEELQPGMTGKAGSKMIISLNFAEDEYVLLNPEPGAAITEVNMGLEWHTGLKLATLNQFIVPQGVSIGAGAVMDDTQTVRITTTGISKDLALPWAESGGFIAGGRAAADAHTAFTCYGCFLLRKEDGTSDMVLARSRANALADPNVIAAGYIYARLVGAVTTGSFAFLSQFIGQGSYEDGNGLNRLQVPTIITNTISTPGVSIGTFVPPNMIGYFTYTIQTSTTGAATDALVGGVVSNPARTNQAPTFITNQVSTEVNHIAPFNRDGATNLFEFKVDNNGQVRHRERVINNSTSVVLLTVGWRMDWNETDII
jgi:hypothetical protein